MPKQDDLGFQPCLRLERRDQNVEASYASTDEIFGKDNAGSYAMEGTVSRPLMLFGLLEHCAEDIPGNRFVKHHFYRKTPLFDRFLAFDVTLANDDMARH